MDPKHHLFMDERLTTDDCIYCGGTAGTRDHVPARAFLDAPFPPDLPVVNACAACNGSTSADEQYLACFLECVICGTTNVSGLRREGIKRTLRHSPGLQARIAASRATDKAGNLLWQPEPDRVRKVLTKLARGHAAYELYPQTEEPAEVSVIPFPLMSDGDRCAFEEVIPGPFQGWPELGTRAFLRAADAYPHSNHVGPWIVVQPGRYRYAVVETGGVLVQMVLSEYLACSVYWE